MDGETDVEALRTRITATETLLMELRLQLYTIEQRTAAARARAYREVRNQIPRGLMKLPRKVRERIYESVLPSRQWLNCYNRASPEDLAVMQVCRSIRLETTPMFYRVNSFALDMRSEHHCLLAWRWLGTLDELAVASLRRVRLTSIIQCSCPASIDARTKRRYGEVTARGEMKVEVTINLDNLENQGAHLDLCGLCGGRRQELEGLINDALYSTQLREDDGRIDRDDVVELFEIVQQASGIVLEDELADE